MAEYITEVFPKIFNHWLKCICHLVAVACYHKLQQTQQEQVPVPLIRSENWWAPRRGSINRYSWIINSFFQTISTLIAKNTYSSSGSAFFHCLRWAGDAGQIFLATLCVKFVIHWLCSSPYEEKKQLRTVQYWQFLSSMSTGIVGLNALALHCRVLSMFMHTKLCSLYISTLTLCPTVLPDSISHSWNSTSGSTVVSKSAISSSMGSTGWCHFR